MAAAGYGFDEFAVPHVWIAARAKAIQVHRIDQGLLLAQQGGSVTNVEREQYLAIFKCQAVYARQQPPPLLGQLGCKGLKFRVLRCSAQQITS